MLKRLLPFIILTALRLGPFTLERSRAKRSEDHSNKGTAGTTKLQRSNATQRIDMLHCVYIKTN